MAMYYINNSPISDNLNILQERNKYSNVKVAELTRGGVSDRHIGKIKNNDSSPSFEVIKSLAKAFKIEPRQLLSPNLDKEAGIVKDKVLTKIIDDYLASNQDGRQLIALAASQSAKQ